jgi:predicted transcriptional regulator
MIASQSLGIGMPDHDANSNKYQATNAMFHKLSAYSFVLFCSHMSSNASDIPKSKIMTVRLTPAINKKLDALARDTKRSKSYLASEAIASFVDLNAWQVAHIKEALDDVRAGSPGASHQEVVDWMESWGTNHELPRPVPRSLR